MGQAGRRRIARVTYLGERPREFRGGSNIYLGSGTLVAQHL